LARVPTAPSLAVANSHVLLDDPARSVATNTLVSAKPGQAELPVARIGEDEGKDPTRLERKAAIAQHGVAELSIRLMPVGDAEDGSVGGHVRACVRRHKQIM